jgi:O-antigen/teichoic acid export membrane protein
MTAAASPPIVARRRLLDRLPVRFNATFVRETSWLAGGFASKLVINLGTMYFMARTLGVDGTGTFLALIGLLSCLVPFVQLGNYDLTVRDVARGDEPRAVAGRAMRSSAAAFLCVLPVVAILRPWLAPAVGWGPCLLLATGELLVMRVVSNVQAVATGFREHYVTAVSDFLLGLTRLAVFYTAFRLAAGTGLTLGLYAFTAVPTALITYSWLVRRIGRPHLRGGPLFTGVADHLRMVVAWFAEMGAQQGDKPLLMAVAGPTETGIYGTAYKLFAVMLVPIDVLTQVFRPRLGRAYADGPAQGRRLYRVTAFGLFSVGLMTGAGLFTAAVLAPHVAPKLVRGPFADARLALMYLSLAPAIYGLQRANIIAAISRGETSAYAKATTVSAAVGLGTLLLLGHAHGWRAACIASQVYLATSCVAMWWLARAAAHRRAAPAFEGARVPPAELVDVDLQELEAAAAG